jgi:hypothetical protein
MRKQTKHKKEKRRHTKSRKIKLKNRLKRGGLFYPLRSTQTTTPTTTSYQNNPMKSSENGSDTTSPLMNNNSTGKVQGRANNNTVTLKDTATIPTKPSQVVGQGEM